jgi:hypothetical protein
MTVLAEAAGFAVLASVSPTALLVMAVYLSTANPRTMALLYVTGAMIMTVATAVALLVVIRITGLNLPRGHDPRFGLRLGLGVLALAGAVFYTVRKKPPEPVPEKQRRPGFMARLMARPSPRIAFVTGLLLFAPGATFIAAVQAVATSDASVPLIVLALVIVVTITAIVVWLPLIAYLAAPDATTRRLAMVNEWLRRHGRTVLVYALGVAGAVLIVNGALGLAGVL